MTVDTFRSLIGPIVAAARGESAGLDDLANALSCGSLGSRSPSRDMSSAWREILISLPLDERSFNDSFPEVRFSPFIHELTNWWTTQNQREKPLSGPEHDTLLGFVGLMLLTLLSLAESDRRRNETSYSVSAAEFDMDPGNEDKAAHADCELCRDLVQAPSVRRVIEAVYDTGANFSVKHDGKSQWC